LFADSGADKNAIRIPVEAWALCEPCNPLPEEPLQVVIPMYLDAETGTLQLASGVGNFVGIEDPCDPGTAWTVEDQKDHEKHGFRKWAGGLKW